MFTSGMLYDKISKCWNELSCTYIWYICTNSTERETLVINSIQYAAVRVPLSQANNYLMAGWHIVNHCSVTYIPVVYLFFIGVRMPVSVLWDAE